MVCQCPWWHKNTHYLIKQKKREKSNMSILSSCWQKEALMSLTHPPSHQGPLLKSGSLCLGVSKLKVHRSFYLIDKVSRKLELMVISEISITHYLSLINTFHFINTVTVTAQKYTNLRYCNFLKFTVQGKFTLR